ncbi:MAG TPA: serine protease, partial [Pyrinomonadaceae bacterium]|nr:serine protease [Pyrinomonadaceae bacterium]
MKTKLALLLALTVIFSITTKAQTTDNITFKVAVVDKSLNLKNVPKFALIVRKAGDASFAERKVSTSFDGTATLSLPAGEYVAVSESPIIFEDRSFTWEHKFKIETGKPAIVELSNDNAKIASASPQTTRRRGSEVGELFKTLRNGVVTIEGELGSGTGFIFDEKGLVLTNQHVISDTMEIRVRFNKDTAVRARLIAKDIDRDLAVLQINLGAFTDSRVLKLAANNPAEPSVFEGEQVFTIGSPANQEKVLSTGTVSKIEARSIISDINFSPGNSGGPLFNSIGEVVGVTTFEVKEKNKSDSGLAGIIRIEETADLIAKAREIAATKGTPSAELMPNLPDGIFPVETIKAAVLSKDFSSKQYLSDIKDYQVKFMTPVYKFYAIEKDRIESLKIRDKRNKSKGMLDADMFRDLRIWKEYAGELMPAVDILALPETSPTAKSMILSAATNLTIGYSTPLAHKYKADFAQMKLMCDGKEVTPLR